jgi:hypothetical protein
MEPQIENLSELEEKVAESFLEDTTPEGKMRNAELAREVADEVYQADDDSDEKVDNGNYPADMDKTLI